MTVEALFGPVAALLLGYLLGSIPFGLILTRAAGLGDLRAMGSGNIGATNVLRTGRRELAAATLLLDAAKGALAVLVAAALWRDTPGVQPIAGLGAFVGHLYPVWLRFRGGKGVATLLGVVGALSWPSALAAAAGWILMLAVTRYSSVAGMTAAVVAPVAAAVLGRFDLVLLFLGFAAFVFLKHRANIERLLAGTEPRVGGSRNGGSRNGGGRDA
jgi:acyl phosphate:glycerol-3-phosphate acyltransferase